MEVVLAKSAGFCFGVARAVQLAEELADTYPGSARMLGPVIHNAHVVEELSRRGMSLLAAPEEAGPGDRVLLRAHGEAQGTWGILRARGAEPVEEQEITLEDGLLLVDRLRGEGLSLRDAVKRAAKELGLSRNQLYDAAVGK